MKHLLDPATDTVTDVFARDRKPVLTVESGDMLVVHTLDASGYLGRPDRPGAADAPRLIADGQRGHCLAGPIAVRGATPGSVLAIRLGALRPDSWGWTVAGSKDTPLNRRLGIGELPPSWLMWDLDGTQGTNNRGHTVALAPFLGVIGLPPDEPGDHSTTPPRTVGGGNIDCRYLTAGSTLYLPITVPDALLCIGDGHAAQGDGEVCGTAIECGMTTELTLDLIADPPIPGIHAETPYGRITFGFSADLNAAMADALDAMVGWMQALYDLDKPTALALASPTVDLRITQVANETWGVHAVLPTDSIR